MDRNTIIGLGIIGVILAMFTYFNQPTEAEKAAQKAKMEQQEAQEENKSASDSASEQANSKEEIAEGDTTNTADTTKNASSLPTIEGYTIVRDEANNIVKDDRSRMIYVDEETRQDTVFAPEPTAVETADKQQKANFEPRELELENENLKVILTNKGGGVKSVFLKKHQTYDNYEPDNKNEKIEPLQLFDAKQATNQLVFKRDGETIETGHLPFEIKEESENEIILSAAIQNDERIEFHYSIAPEAYHINYEIYVKNLQGKVMPENVKLNWNAEMFKTERLLSEQRRTSTVFFKEKNGSYDYLSEYSDDQFAAETDVDWVAFKQSYFSSILMPEKSFNKSGTNFKIETYQEGSEKDSTHIKKYTSSMNLNLNDTRDGRAQMTWYFGPNDYDLLTAYGNGSEDIINLGWGLFRWINVYAIQPIFNWLAGYGMNLGIAILLLTFIVKLVLTPIQWKMYTSSAKMRILKPEIEEINKKYPDKEDAMKKQMETMTLYRESGASPLSGCVPMLIQMPILFAVFRFFPSSFTLRQESFLWAEDLSSYDSIVDLGFNIPFYGDHISLFTLLMAGTTLFYTVLNSSNMQQPSQPGMPNMKIIMYFFPIMMIFFFNNYASGLSYYYFISTLISILTMLLIKNYFVDEEKLKGKMAAKKENKQKGGKKGKSKFQARLEEMQKAQQEKMKNKKK
ncbi:MAG: membrane protein insertase YidC [Bacteroidota bacterium]